MKILEITERPVTDSSVVLEMSGHFVGQAAQDVKERLKELVAEGYNQLVVDMSQVPHIDSAGLAALVSGLKAAREVGGTLVLVGLEGKTLKVLRLTLLDRVFESYPDVDTALHAVTGT